MWILFAAYGPISGITHFLYGAFYVAEVWFSGCIQPFKYTVLLLQSDTVLYLGRKLL